MISFCAQLDAQTGVQRIAAMEDIEMDLKTMDAFDTCGSVARCTGTAHGNAMTTMVME